MTFLLQGAVIVGFFLAANIVAAGVVLVLGRLLQAIAPGWSSPWPWLLICAAGAIAAYLFLKGAMFFAAERNPHKGLQSGAGRRGG